jgi:CheY-like chemotaxis protein
LLREVLGDEHHDVVLAINGRQGLELVAKEQPDLVFMDFMMPVLNGAAMLKAMTADPSMAQIPVVIMSSLPEATISERAEGHVAFVRKPFQIETILAITATVLDAER